MRWILARQRDSGTVVESKMMNIRMLLNYGITAELLIILFLYLGKRRLFQFS